MKKTIDKIKNQIGENSLHTCEYISGEAKPSKKIKVKCVIHNEEFEASYDTIRKSTNKHHICPKCKAEDSAKDKVELICDYCGKTYLKAKSKAARFSFHFCCRVCKDAAQKVSSGDKFNLLRPDHYGTGKSNYREKAFEVYPHKCAICGWDEDEYCLEVHHIDENRQNNELENLIILCAICHKKLTIHKYYLSTDRTCIIKK